MRQKKPHGLGDLGLHPWFKVSKIAFYFPGMRLAVAKTCSRCSGPASLGLPISRRHKEGRFEIARAGCCPLIGQFLLTRTSSR